MWGLLDNPLSAGIGVETCIQWVGYSLPSHIIVPGDKRRQLWAYIEERGPHSKDQNAPFHYGAGFWHPGQKGSVFVSPSITADRFLVFLFANNAVPLVRRVRHERGQRSSNHFYVVANGTGLIRTGSPFSKGPMATTRSALMVFTLLAPVASTTDLPHCNSKINVTFK